MVWSSASANGHVGLSVIPNLWKYDLNFPCPVTIDVNSGDTGSSCRSLFLTKGKNDLVNLLGVKRPERGIDHPPTPSAEVKERVELYIYSPSGPLWPVLG